MVRSSRHPHNSLLHNLDAIYIDEAHHYPAPKTYEVISGLIEESGAFLYGTTATPDHYMATLRGDIFENEYWANLEAINPTLKDIISQMETGIKKGETIPFEKIYALDGEFLKSLNSAEVQGPILIQRANHFFVINPDYYPAVARGLSPLLLRNKKGLILTASIEEAESLANFFQEAFEEKIVFEAYHSNLSDMAREEILERSRNSERHFLIAVKSLDEGINLPHLSTYIDLNTSISLKQMIHRLGRVLRAFPGKLEADILFFVENYRNAEGAMALLEIMESSKRISSLNRSVRMRRSTSEDMSLASFLEMRNMDIQGMLERSQRLLEGKARYFWGQQTRSGDFVRINVDEIQERAREAYILASRPSNPFGWFQDWLSKTEGMPSYPTFIKRFFKETREEDFRLADFLGDSRIRRHISPQDVNVDEVQERAREAYILADRPSNVSRWFVEWISKTKGIPSYPTFIKRFNSTFQFLMPCQIDLIGF